MTSPPTPRRAILVLALASFVGAANLRVCDALLPQIAQELAVTVGTAAAMVTAFAVAYGLCQIVVGPLGDARGKLRMVVLGSIWAGVATIIGAAMPSLAPLVVFRFLAGAGAAAVIPLAIAWIGDVVAYERRQAVLTSVFIEGMAMFGALAYIGADLHARFEVGLGAVGALLGSFGGGALLFAVSANRLVPRLGQPLLAALGTLVLASSYLTLAIMPALWLAAPAIAGIGLGFYMLHNTLQVNATQMTPEARGLAVSLFAFFLFTGQSIGVALGAPVVDRFGARPVFAIAAVVLVLVAFWFRARLIKQTAAS